VRPQFFLRLISSSPASSVPSSSFFDFGSTVVASELILRVNTTGLLLTADDNIYFAGEHLSILQGWQEGAILSAYRVINGIVSRDAS